MAFDIKKFLGEFWENVKKVNPFAPGFSFGGAKDIYERGKEEVKDMIKPFTFPLLLIVIILVLILIFWRKFQKLLGI